MSTHETELGGMRMPLLVLDGVQAWAVAAGVRPVLPMHCKLPPHWRGLPIAIGASSYTGLDELTTYLAEADMARAVGLPAEVPSVGQLRAMTGRIVAVLSLADVVHWTELRGHPTDVWAGAPWNWRVACVHPLHSPVLTARCARSGLGYLDGTAVWAVSAQLGGV